MNICMMTNTYLPHVGGVARSVETFAQEYRRMGHHTWIVAPTFAKIPGESQEEEEEEEHVIRIPAIQNFNGSDFSVRLPLSVLFTRLTGSHADVVHAHHPFLLGDTALRYAANIHAPVIFTHHTLYEEYTHYVPFDSPALKQFVIELSTHYANLCDGVIAPSQSIASLIQERGVEVPIRIIPTGIDLAQFGRGDKTRGRISCGIPEDAFVIGHVGRLAREKNLAYLSNAVAKVLKEESKAHFLVVGDGPYAPAIQDIFQSNGAGDRLHCPGKKTGRELVDAYAAMDLFVFTSQSETQGMVIAEAMAAGLPVVALDASGVREVVADQSNGTLLPAHTGENVFGDHVTRFLKDPSVRRKCSKEALATARRFSKERCATMAIEFYEEILNKTRRQREQAEHDFWTSLLNRTELEWNLLSEKAESAFQGLISESSPSDKDRRDRSR